MYNHIMDKIKLFTEADKIKVKTMCACDAFETKTESWYECLYDHILKQCKKQWTYAVTINNNKIILDPVDIASLAFQYVLEYDKRYDYGKKCSPTVFWFAYLNAKNALIDEEKKHWMSYWDLPLDVMEEVMDTTADIEENYDKKIKSEKMFEAIRKEFGQKWVDIIEECIATNSPILAVFREKWLGRNEYNAFMKKRKKLKLF